MEQFSQLLYDQYSFGCFNFFLFRKYFFLSGSSFFRILSHSLSQLIMTLPKVMVLLIRQVFAIQMPTNPIYSNTKWYLVIAMKMQLIIKKLHSYLLLVVFHCFMFFLSHLAHQMKLAVAQFGLRMVIFIYFILRLQLIIQLKEFV
jgi:hypothetical protein